jgi:HK97 family phage portal protein
MVRITRAGHDLNKMAIETLSSLALAAGHDLRAIPKSETSGVAKPESWLVSALGGSATNSGIRVGPGNALMSVPVWACVSLISESIAQLPLFLMHKLPNGNRQFATDHELYPLLKDAPNDFQTSFEFREMLQGHMLLRGNAYAYVLRDNNARIISLIPLHPDRVSLRRSANRQIFYEVSDEHIRGTFPRWQIFHLRGMSSDGYCGLSPISACREAVGLSLVTQEHGARLFSNGTILSGVLEYPEALNGEIIGRIRDQWNSTYGGVRNSNKVAILEKGMKWQSLGMTNEDAQFLATRAFQNNEIYRMFRVPPHMVGDQDKVTSWGSGIEQLSIGFVQFTLQPHITRWEQAISQVLLLPNERPKYYVKFELKGLLRGDMASRSKALATMRQNGVINADEWREIEDMDAIGGVDGESYLVNGAMVPTSLAGQQKTATAAPIKLLEETDES